MTPFERALASGGNLVAAWDLERGARARISRFLRQVTTPSAVLRAMNGLIEAHDPR